MNFLIRKLNTGIKILLERGPTDFKYYFMAFLRGIFKKNIFKTISESVKEEIYNDHIEISKILAKSVAYVQGQGVKGDIAEFGTMTGQTAVALATATNLYNIIYRKDFRGTKKLHFFDSFEGLPESRFNIDQKSLFVSNGVWTKGSCQGLSISEFSRLISNHINKEYFKIYPGWFKDTVPKINKDLSFALIHIDGDLYESAIDVLENLFKNRQVSNGAIILFDDWNSNAANPSFGERRAFNEVCEKYKIKFSDAGSYGSSCQRFIIHSYISE